MLDLIEVGLTAPTEALRGQAGQLLGGISSSPSKPPSVTPDRLGVGDLEELVLYGLGTEDAAVRALAVELFGDYTRWHQAPQMQRLSALLEDPAADVAARAARRLWYCARCGPLATKRPEPVARALQSPVANVPFFAALSLAWEAAREGAAAPVIPLPTGEPDIGEVVFVGAQLRRFCLHRLPAELAAAAPPGSPDSVTCLGCGRPGAELAGYDNVGSNAGGTRSHAFICSSCRLYTIEEWDWG